MSTAVRLTQIDGKLPNLALMKLAHWHRAQGHTVTFTRRADRSAFEPEYDAVYASAIFAFSAPKVEHFRREWPGALVGGTGTGARYTVEDVIGVPDGEYEHYDYTDYPDFEASIGFTQRGCRLRCKFCVVPEKEGKNRSVNTIADIWRGPGHPKKIDLLDNDFLGQPEPQWRARVDELNEGGFKTCINQGVNFRLMNQPGADALASLSYWDFEFKVRRLYTAWDNMRDEAIFFRGVDLLERAGVKPRHIMAYMLVGFWPDETLERVLYRVQKMKERGILPYPMVYDCRPTDPARYDLMKRVQRWVVRGSYHSEPFEKYDPNHRRRDHATLQLFAQAGAE